MKECWLSPYGEVIYTNGKWDHASKAAEIILERYNNGSWENTSVVFSQDPLLYLGKIQQMYGVLLPVIGQVILHLIIFRMRVG